MLSNYEEGLRKLEIVTNVWRHKYLTIFGKITVIKTFMLSTLSHIAAILPTPPKVFCKKFESIMINFIKGERKSADINEVVKGRSSIVSQDVIFAPKSNNGLGLQCVSTFWASIKMGWLRRLGHDSFWKTLHLEDLKDKSLLFNPYKTSEAQIQSALKNMKNPVMRQIYISLINCKSNIIEIDPTSSLFLPIYGESRVTKTNTPALSEWTIGARIIDVTTSNGKFIREDVHIKNALKQPSSLQYSALKNHIKPSFRDIYKSADTKRLQDNCPFNIYGPIVYKTKSRCSHFYKILNFKANKTLLWESRDSPWKETGKKIMSISPSKLTSMNKLLNLSSA